GQQQHVGHGTGEVQPREHGDLEDERHGHEQGREHGAGQAHRSAPGAGLVVGGVTLAVLTGLAVLAVRVVPAVLVVLAAATALLVVVLAVLGTRRQHGVPRVVPGRLHHDADDVQ